MPKELAQKAHRWSCCVFAINIVVALVAIGAVASSIVARRDLTPALGLALSIVVAHVATISPFLRKPRLALFVDDAPCSPPIEQGDTPSWFLRVGIVNYGLRPARDCVGRLLGVWTAQGQQLMKFDPLTLFWARQDRDHTGLDRKSVV